ncbi:uncharacterized protein LOC125489526 [Plutella xylostella]|uniref:uncharacterized protein LOC125489526 n=1 Tax=Plutella xylostella TaxID=51655 RepID=UPI0020326435|nr:uncharacterized protein LOC125489526 [Plutella xylostella]
MVKCVKGYECVSPRLLWMRLKVGLRKLFVLGVYAPDMSKNISIREEFWESVRETLMICEDNEYVIMLGDFNGRVGVKRTGYESVLGTFGDVSVNENGESLLERIRVERLRDECVKEKYLSNLKEKNSDMSAENMEEWDFEYVWDRMKRGLVDAATEVCGISKKKNDRKGNTYWWDDEVRMIVDAKKKAWLDILAAKASNCMSDEIEGKESLFRNLKKSVKDIVKRKKQERKEMNDKRFSDNFRANVKMFWKFVRTARGKSEESKMNVVRDEDGCILNDETLVLKRWKEYFDVSEEASVSSTSDPSQDKDSESEISMDEIMKAMKSMKVGKAAGYDRITMEMLRAGEGLVASLLWLFFKICCRRGQVPGDWCGAVIVTLYKGKGSQQDCRNYRGISLLSIVGKLYAKVLIERVMKET